ncbi:LysR family transcriptional regulator [Pseudomonas sp. MAP12]|uniref:LysR family transcriptional regulator n=1 Tax=Geopseudomonas aromaticivorans TaxID=2849492 RepID=A0ABS6MUN3_9GAMM|nr:LysR substrate-binding domain-containing protein [Pseudomonas aromaticivorans]MBV2132475.1 LysR family transcriptional regulator [Pseudomonas aromaticivorans]
MNLETKWLEDFVALAATRSFSRAAEQRFVTQPAFSRRIKALEEALGLTLVNRARTPVELTEAGQLFLITARNLVEQLGEVVRRLHAEEGQQGEVLRFAAAHSLALSFFPEWIAGLRRTGLPISSRLLATNVGEAVHALREGTCDLILAYYDPDAALQLAPELFPSLPLGRSEMLPVCAVGEDGRPLYDLDGGQTVPLLAYSAGTFLGRPVSLLLRRRGLRSSTVYETAMADSLKGMALQGLGVAWVPRLSVSAELARGELAVCGDERWQVPLEIRLYRCALLHKPAVRRLWKALEEGKAGAAGQASDAGNGGDSGG